MSHSNSVIIQGSQTISEPHGNSAAGKGAVHSLEKSQLGWTPLREQVIRHLRIKTSMTRISKASVVWDGLVDNLRRAIKSWSPASLGREIEYRDSLTSHLGHCAPGARIQKEYHHLSTISDIYFEFDGFLNTANAFIEVRYNLLQESQLDRLIGQIENLQARKHRIIIVFCGNTEPMLLRKLKAQYKNQLGWNVHIIEKRSAARALV
jgi:hypothetical protein